MHLLSIKIAWESFTQYSKDSNLNYYSVGLYQRNNYLCLSISLITKYFIFDYFHDHEYHFITVFSLKLTLRIDKINIKNSN